MTTEKNINYLHVQGTAEPPTYYETTNNSDGALIYIMTINDIPVTCNVDATIEELTPYVQLAQAKYPHAQWVSLDIRFVGEEVELHYNFTKQNFQRIRRITGYLVGDESSWNNAKLDELKHRRKHDITYEER